MQYSNNIIGSHAEPRLREAIIIYHQNDFDWLTENINTDLIYSSKILYILGDNKNSSVLADYSNDFKINVDLIGKLSVMWYRDKNGKSLFDSKYCYGGFFQRRLRYLMGNFFRHLRFFGGIKTNYHKIYLPKGLGYEVLEAAKFNNLEIEEYNSKAVPDDFFLPNLNLGDIVPFKPLVRSLVANFLQTPFRMFLRKKVACLRDWSYASPVQTKTNWLYQYSINLFRGLYFRKNAESVSYPMCIDENIINKNINRELKANFINPTLTSEISAALTSLIKVEWRKSIRHISKGISYSKTLMDDYDPMTLIVPGMNNLLSQSCIEVFRNKNRPIIVIPDGVLSYFDRYDAFYRPESLNFSVSKILLNPYLTHALHKNNQIDMECIVNVKNHFPKSQNKKTRYQDVDFAIICFPYGYATNPEYRWDMSFDYCFECLKCLKALGLKKIGIKLKKTNHRSFRNLKQSLRLGLNKAGFEKVKIFDGSFSETLDIATLIIGGLGSSALEAIEAKIDYFIYEPKYNGFTDEIIGTSVFAPNDISTSYASLFKKLSKGETVNSPLSFAAPIEITSINL